MPAGVEIGTMLNKNDMKTNPPPLIGLAGFLRVIFYWTGITPEGKKAGNSPHVNWNVQLKM